MPAPVPFPDPVDAGTPAAVAAAAEVPLHQHEQVLHDETPPQESTAPVPAPRRRFGFVRRLIGPIAGPIAHYVRRYLQASVEHELRETRAHLTALSADFRLINERLDLTQQALDTLIYQQARADQRLQALLPEIHAIIPEVRALVPEIRAAVPEIRSLVPEIRSVVPEIRSLVPEIRSLVPEIRAITPHVLGLRDPIAALSPPLDALAVQLGAVQAQGVLTAQDLVRLPGLFGPRFDEIEIKQRPLVPYDDESMGIRMREGYVLAPRSSPAFVTMLANASSRGLEPGTRDTLMRLVQPGMTVADIGANIGLLTLVCATATGPAGRVIAFEPEAVPRAHLQKMIALNGLSWVEVRDQAVGAAPGRVSFNVSDIIGHSSLYALPEDEQARARTIEVEVVTMDKVLNGKRLDVAKIDVEGAELDVLEGMAKLIAANPDLAIVAEFGPSHLKRIGQTPARWFKAFAQAGFTAYIIDETTGDCAPCTAASTAKVVSANIAFVRPDGDAERRLLKA